MINTTAEIYSMGVAAHPQGKTTNPHRLLDITALRRAYQGSMADVLSGDLQSHPLHTILTAMLSVQEAENALDTLISEYLKTQGTDEARLPTYTVGRLVRCAANFLFEEFEIAGSPHGKRSWNHVSVSDLLRLCAKIEPCGKAHTLLALQAAVLRQGMHSYQC